MNKDIIPLIVYPENSGYVNCLMPEIHGTGKPGAIIKGQINSNSFSVNVLQNGVWNYKCENPLTDCTDNLLTITQTGTDGKTSAPVNVQFRADTKALVNQSVTFPANNQFINTTTPQICGIGKAGATIEVKINKAVYTTIVNQDGNWQIQIDLPLPEGTAYAEIVQKDMGNLSPVKSIHFCVDTALPKEPKIEKPKYLGYENTPNPVVSGKGKPYATIDAVVDDRKYSAPVSKSGDWSFEISQTLIDDTHIVGVKQKDAAGNISPENMIIFTVDTKQPNAPEITFPSNGANICDNRPMITGRGEYGNRIDVKFNEKVYSCLVSENGTWNIKITDAINDGTASFKVYQISKSGNVSPCMPFTVKVDTIAPLMPTVIYPENDGYVTSPCFEVKGTGEPDAQIECSVAGKEYSAKVESDGSFVLNIDGNENILAGQAYSLILKQIDPAGNESPALRVKFRIDTQCLNAPQINSPAADSAVNTAIPIFCGKAKPGAAVTVNIGNECFNATADENGKFQLIVNKSLPQGINVANIYQCDKGNVSPSSSVSFTVDTVAPLMPKIDYPLENAVIKDKNLIIKGIGEAGGTVEILLDDKSYRTDVKNDGNWEFTVPETLENGTHAALVSQTDRAGNKSQSARIFFISNALTNVQSVGKVVESHILYNPQGSGWASQIIINMKTNVPVTVDNVCGKNFSKIVCKNGIYAFDFVDACGKLGKATAGVTWVDSKPPVIVVDTNGNYFSSDKTVSYFKPSGAAISLALINDIPFESGKKVTDDGFYKIDVTDMAGNTASESFIIDKTPPSISGAENQKVYNCDVCITFSDNLAGIKDAELNGNYFASGTVLTQSGEFSLTVSDYADNKAEISFKIQK